MDEIQPRKAEGAKPDAPKPNGSAHERKKRLVPRSHNFGDPIVNNKLPPDYVRALRKATKKGFRQAMSQLNHRGHLITPPAQPCSTVTTAEKAENPIPAPAFA